MDEKNTQILKIRRTKIVDGYFGFFFQEIKNLENNEMRKQECKTIGTQRNCHSFEMRFRLKKFYEMYTN